MLKKKKKVYIDGVYSCIYGSTICKSALYVIKTSVLDHCSRFRYRWMFVYCVGTFYCILCSVCFVNYPGFVFSACFRNQNLGRMGPS